VLVGAGPVLHGRGPRLACVVANALVGRGTEYHRDTGRSARRCVHGYRQDGDSPTA